MIAAGLGHAAAASIAPAIGLGPIELVETPEDTAAGPPGAVRARAGIAVARAMETEYRARVRARSSAATWSLLSHCEAAEAWAVGGAPGQGLPDLLRIEVNDCPPECCWDPEAYPAQLVALALHLVARSAAPSEPPRELYPATWFVTISDMFARPLAGEPQLEELRSTCEQAVRAEVVSWVLGYADPVRERVAARREG